MEYVFRCTRNRGVIRVPLAVIVEYRGIIALVKAEVNTTLKAEDYDLTKPI